MPGIPFVKTLARDFFCIRPIRTVLERTPGIRKIYSPVLRTHPIDSFYGIDTSGVCMTDRITRDQELRPLIRDYVGSQPSIIRHALRALGNVDEYTFIDLGCGKGRVLAVASEFPFRRVIGVELSAKLAAVARKNADRVCQGHAGRASIEVVEGNVLEFPVPQGKLVFFNYNAFGSEVHAALVRRLEFALSKSTPHVFFIHYNPVEGSHLDASAAFTRYYADHVACDHTEAGFAPSAGDSVIIWQSVRGAMPTPHHHANRNIVILGPMQAEIEK